MLRPSTKGRRPIKYSVDEMMSQLALHLIGDFRTNLSEPGFCKSLSDAIQTESITGRRGLVPAVDQSMDVARFKATYQLQSIFKRYRFSKDTYSDDELLRKSKDDFKATQSRLRALRLDSIDSMNYSILKRAAGYISNVLGEYDDEEHRRRSRFGKKASVGVPGRVACEAARWELPISGSREQIEWFDSEMSHVECVQEYWRAQKESDPAEMQRSIYHEVDSLKLTLVPKTFKSHRAIMPNTTIGSYMSYGLGEMIRVRLQRNGYDIRSLQMTHRRLAREASVHGFYVTADLSSASDSISVALVERLFPADWLEILKKSRISKVVLPPCSLYPSETIESETFATMGVGYTFPLQTLIFLALLKGAEACYNLPKQRMISVYGDDLIYNRYMHSTVIQSFEQFGFVFNSDKTNYTGHFRESCGGDFYRGVDVRPFQPRSDQNKVGKPAYEAMLYKCINGLLMRWDKHEVESTLHYLASELEKLVGRIKLVPKDFPDGAGVKSTNPHRKTFCDVRVAAVTHVGHGLYRFSFLGQIPVMRKEVRHEPYLWAALRGDSTSVIDYSDELDPRFALLFLDPFLREVEEKAKSRPSLILCDERTTKPIHLKDLGRRRVPTATFTAVGGEVRYKRQSGISTFGIPWTVVA